MKKKPHVRKYAITNTGKLAPTKQRIPRSKRPMSELRKQINSAAYARRNLEFSADIPVGKEIW